MAWRLTQTAPFEAENALEASLRVAFESLQPSLRPPFSLSIPTPDQYALLNGAILHGALTEPHFSKTHIKHLHAIVTDGYATFVNLLLDAVLQLYPKLLHSVKTQLLWLTEEMVHVLAIGYDAVLVSLLRQIAAADCTEGNLNLCSELVTLFLKQFDRLLEDAPHVLSSALYAFLRVLSDQFRVCVEKFETLKRLDIEKLETLKRREIHLCVKIVREEFHLCLKIGRDFIRLLQDLAHVPEFKALLQDIVFNPSVFNVVGFKDVSQIYCTRTSSRYSLLRISPEMETQLRFLLTDIKLGHHRRHQLWFANKFLNERDKEFLIVDIVRFICCAHHPPNEIIQSDIFPRWALIGWLLTCCRKKHVEESVKLALFYDWLFFDERMDSIMNIEPAILLMVHSVPKFINMTHALLEFLLHLVDRYDVGRRSVIVKGVSSAFQLLVRKGVVRSLNVLTSCSALNPGLREGLKRLLSDGKVGSS
ncbi:Integrator complex subunit 3 [Glycine soja]|uniref:Integrator complex subunit 3 n=1 Tax=Glycine soja TaxID=3848 RepID=A0A445F7A2_GLYSO|nr:Integrator complex subunit 3 [Glycine soja]RZB44708.1 Integrator complex subunit 3 [Glycine soja]